MKDQRARQAQDGTWLISTPEKYRAGAYESETAATIAMGRGDCVLREMQHIANEMAYPDDGVITLGDLELSRDRCICGTGCWPVET